MHPGRFSSATGSGVSQCLLLILTKSTHGKSCVHAEGASSFPLDWGGMIFPNFRTLAKLFPFWAWLLPDAAFRCYAKMSYPQIRYKGTYGAWRSADEARPHVNNQECI